MLGRNKMLFILPALILAFACSPISESMAIEWGDVVMDSNYESMQKKGLDKVLFPHWIHRIRYRCKACHPKYSTITKGTTGINMKGIIGGRWCGRCHNDDIAFSAAECKRCHFYSEKDEKQFKSLVGRNYPSISTSKDIKKIEQTEQKPNTKDVFLRKVLIDPKNNIFINLEGRLGSIGEPGTRFSLPAKLGFLSKPEALKNLKTDRFGLIDWVAAVKDKTIAPIAGTGEYTTDKFEDYVIPIKPKSKILNPVYFPHDVHSYHLDCKTCHPAIFVSKEGKNPGMTMEAMENGMWCGKCHGKVAFPLDDCARCHKEKGNKLAQQEIIASVGENNGGNEYSVEVREITRGDDDLVFIKGGCFQMGDPSGRQKDGIPVHEVCVNDFFISDHELTQKEWKKMMYRKNPSYNKGDNFPVEQVSRGEIQKFLKNLNRKTKRKYRLPTEAEWEYAARGGSDGNPPPVDNEKIIGQYAWSFLNSKGKTSPVKKKKPNEFGLYDMLGNVWEWCSDWYDETYYKKSPKDNPKGPDEADYKVIKGGSWSNIPGDLRPANRKGIPEFVTSSGVGFRIVRDGK